MALIDVVSWDDSSSGTAGEGPLFAWKFPGMNLSTFTQLLVRESQEAILFTKGRLLGKFGPGKHTLNTENLPLLRNLFGLPFGGKNPFFAEVWFVNKVVPLNIDWDTTSVNPVSQQAFSMMYQDPDYGAMVPLRAVGRYGLKVQDAERFLIKLVGAASRFYASELTEHFRGAMNAKTKTVLLSYMQAQHIGIKSISAYLEPISQALKSSMRAFWEDYGFNLEGFYITSVEIDSSSSDGQKILSAIAGQSAQLIAGYSWQQAKAFEVAENAVDAAGKGGMLGALMMTNMMGAGGGAMGAMLQPSPGGVPASGASGQVGSGVAPVPREVFCSNCSKKYSSSSKFCPHCGDPYVPCPRCGTDNDKAARRCVSCGTPLESAASCPKCGMQLPPGAIICPRCVRGVGGTGTCAQCGSLLAPEDGFCSECGKKVE
jgi:membrane protease subunit (stomatin/prohibitin family)